MKERILRLLKHYYKLLERQWNENSFLYDAAYYMELYRSETKILHFFGLPENPKNYILLSNWNFLQYIYQHTPEKVFEYLSKRAEKYLSTRSRTGRELLALAKKRLADPCDILSELKIPIHSYSLYLYREFVLKDEFFHQSVLQEFNFLKKQDILADIYWLCFDKNYRYSPIYKKLSDTGLQFLDCFLLWHHNKTGKKINLY